MDKIKNPASGFLCDEEGQDIIEYGLLAAFISIVVVTILFGFSAPLSALYETVLAGLKVASP
jgi:Flp pilus assembly pilin Flp